MSALRRILVLGHSGFLGRRIFETLSSKFQTVCVEGRSVSDLDLTQKADTDLLTSLLDESTAVIICAAIKREFGDSFENFLKNVSMIENLCQVIRKTSVGRVVFLSSTAVYGEDVPHDTICEKTPVQPTTYYGMAKFCSENILEKTFRDLGRTGLVCLRPPVIYGPGEAYTTYSPSGFATLALRNEPIALWGDGTEKREFIFVQDVVRVICGLMESDFSGVLNLASGKSYTFLESLDILRHQLGAEVRTTHRPRTKAKVDHYFENSLFSEAFSDFKFTSLKSGLEQTLHELGHQP